MVCDIALAVLGVAKEKGSGGKRRKGDLTRKQWGGEKWRASHSGTERGWRFIYGETHAGGIHYLL